MDKWKLFDYVLIVSKAMLFVGSSYMLTKGLIELGGDDEVLATLHAIWGSVGLLTFLVLDIYGRKERF